MNKPKTIREWLETLPDGYRELALKYYNPKYHDGLSVNSLSSAILGTCHWRSTSEEEGEGFEFWNAVYEWTHGRGELPPLPQETRWVRVEDGLPTHSRVVLLTDGRWRTVGFNNGDSWMVYEDEPMDMEYSTFTHWMEYPELPEEEK